MITAEVIIGKFISGLFQIEKRAHKVMEVLPKWFEKYGLSLNMKKTRLILFGKPDITGKYIPGTFDFPGFTFYWGKSLRGYWVIKKKTKRKSLKRFMKVVWYWCKKERHLTLKEQYKALCSKLRGFYQYFGVICNSKALKAAYEHVNKTWRYWLSRRSHKGGIDWEKFSKLKFKYPLPLPRIIHSI